MPIVAPSVCRYTVVGTLAGQDCQNIFDVAITDEDIGVSRNEQIAEVAGDLLNQWSDHVLPLLVNQYTANEVRWVDLDTADGGTGSISSTDGSDWPQSGARAVPPLPNNTYAKLVKNLEGKTRLQRNGALRLGGICEEDTIGENTNILSTTARTNLNTAFENLKDGINGAIGGATVNLVVVHTVDQVFTGSSDIAQYSCASTVGTIRRRMPGYGS